MQAEHEKLKESQKLIADLKEELAIAEGRVKQAHAEKEQIQIKAKEIVGKMQKLTDESQDKDDKIDQLNTTIEILNSDKTYIKKSYDSLLEKYKRIQDENILIPKKNQTEEEKGDKLVKDYLSPKRRASKVEIDE